MGKASRRRRRGAPNAATSASVPPDVASRNRSTASLLASRKEQHCEIAAERRRVQRGSLNPQAYADFLLCELDGIATDDPWDTARLEIFMEYFDVFVSLPILTTVSSWEYEARRNHEAFLKNVRRNKAESNLFRAAAYGATANLFFFEMGCHDYFADILDFIEKCIHLVDSANPSEKQRRVSMDGRSVLAEELFDKVRSDVMRTEEISKKISELYAMGAWSANGQHVLFSMLAGLQCDFCQKHRDDCENGFLFHCSRCKMVYYCSHECQKSSWTEHKHGKWCRKKGEFRTNDIAMLMKKCRHIKGGTKVRLIAPSSDGEIAKENLGKVLGDVNDDPAFVDYWVVQEHSGEARVCVPVDTLKRIRAPLWYPFTRKDLEMIAKVLLEDQKSVSFSSGEVMVVPLLGVHSDPKYFEEEEEVDETLTKTTETS